MTESEQHEKKLIGLLAEYDSPESLVSAVRELRDGGYRCLEAFSPFPVHGLDRALAIRPSPLPWIVLLAGVSGAFAALAGQWWTNAVNYPFLISGKPLFSLPANIPVTFEVIILCSAFATFFGMLALNRLPRLSNPLFRQPRFVRATTDGFFLLVESSDTKFSEQDTAAILRSTNARQVEPCRDEHEPGGIPKPLFAGLAICAVLAVIPPLLIARSRATTSERSRFRTFSDMDYQPKLKSQTTDTLFSDGRAMRPPVAGVVARGELQENIRLYRGIDSLRGISPETGSAEADVSGSDATDSKWRPADSSDRRPTEADGATPSEPQSKTTSGEAAPEAGGEEQGASAGEEAEPDWVTTFPVRVTDELMRRGRQRFNIYCATCHGRAGDGNGIVSVRAMQLQQGTWLPPTSLYADHVRSQPVGQLFNTISHGIRKMPGYADQIAPEDRWAIVLYVRALQRSRASAAEDVPKNILPTLRDLN